MFHYIQSRISCRGTLRNHFSGKFLSVDAHSHTRHRNAICQQIRGRDAGVIKTAYTVKLQENIAAGEGREAGYTHFIISLDTTYIHRRCGRAVSAVPELKNNSPPSAEGFETLTSPLWFKTSQKLTRQNIHRHFNPLSSIYILFFCETSPVSSESVSSDPLLTPRH